MAKRKTKKKSSKAAPKRQKKVKRAKGAKRASTPKKKASGKKSVSNRKAYWDAYRDLQKRVDQAWAKLRAGVARKVSPQVLIRDKNNLLLLLGECNYMARECMRLSNKSERS